MPARNMMDVDARQATEEEIKPMERDEKGLVLAPYGDFEPPVRRRPSWSCNIIRIGSFFRWNAGWELQKGTHVKRRRGWTWFSQHSTPHQDQPESAMNKSTIYITPPKQNLILVVAQNICKISASSETPSGPHVCVWHGMWRWSLFLKLKQLKLEPELRLIKN